MVNVGRLFHGLGNEVALSAIVMTNNTAFAVNCIGIPAKAANVVELGHGANGNLPSALIAVHGERVGGCQFVWTNLGDGKRWSKSQFTRRALCANLVLRRILACQILAFQSSPRDHYVLRDERSNVDVRHPYCMRRIFRVEDLGAAILSDLSFDRISQAGRSGLREFANRLAVVLQSQGKALQSFDPARVRCAKSVQDADS